MMIRTITCLVMALLIGQVLSSLFECSFERGLCDMEQSSEDRLNWIRHEGVTPTIGTGPISGAKDSRFYIYLEGSDPAREFYTARILTPELRYKGDVCISFYSHMYGANVANMALFRQTGEDSSAYRNPFAFIKHSNENWIKYEKDVKLTNSRDKVGFTAVRGSDYLSDIGLDSIKITEGMCSQQSEETVRLPWSCDFETESICSMRQPTNDDFDWTRYRDNTPSVGTGPEDAQKGVWYMYIEASDPRRPYDVAYLETPAFMGYSGEACISFYYNMNGIDVKDLQIYTSKNGPQSPLKTYYGNKGSSWHLGNVTVPITSGVKIGFIASRGNDIRGDIAIDNVLVKTGNCIGNTGKLPYTCDFERDFCGMTQRDNDDFDWTRTKHATPTDGTGPDKAQRNDYFIYTEMSSPRRNGDKAYIDSPSMQYVGQVCITFFYHQNGDDMGGLLVYTSFRGEERPVFRVTGSKGDVWHQAVISTTLSFEERVVFIAKRGQGVRGDIAIDFLEIKAGNCIGYTTPGISTTPGPFTTTSNTTTTNVTTPIKDPTYTTNATTTTPTSTTTTITTTTTTPTSTTTTTPKVTDQVTTRSKVKTTTSNIILDKYSCDLENESTSEKCVIKQDSSDDFDWTRQALETPSGRQHNRRIDGQKYPITGPERALNGDYYLFIEASGRRDKDVARIELQGDSFINSAEEQCLSFAYNMNGYHTGVLRVYVRVDGGRRRVIWSISGDQGVKWHRGSAYVGLQRVTEIGFEGETDGQFSGDIALDDISMKSGRCQEISDDDINNQLKYLMKCDFETNEGSSTMCDLEQDRDDDFDMKLWKGHTPSDETGPSRAYNGNYYIYAEASKPRREGDKAGLFLPNLRYDGRVCLQFHYHMYGYHTGRLDVIVKRERSDEYSLEWSAQGEQGNRWLQRSVTIDLNYNNRIAFRIIRAEEFSGDISLDAIFVKRNSC